MNKKRVLIAITLFFTLMVIAFNFILFISYMNMNKSQFRAQVINKNSDRVLKLEYTLNDLYKNKNGVQWHDNNKELEITGVFYEVIYTKIENSKAIVFVISDEEESNLYQEFSKSKNNSNHNFTELINFLFSLNFLSSFSEFIIHKTETQSHCISKTLLFIDFNYCLKEIKPPRF